MSTKDLIPREPTREMRIAGTETFANSASDTIALTAEQIVIRIWQNMHDVFTRKNKHYQPKED